MMQNPLPTSPAVSTTQPTSPAVSPQGWNSPPVQFSMQPPRKKSRTWAWVLGLLGLGVLMCGLGLLGFLGLAVYYTPEEDPGIATETNSKQTSPTPTASPLPDSKVQKADLSQWETTSTHGTVTFSGGELFMTSARARYYYAMCAAADFKTEDSAVRVTVRNVNGAASELGYGLIFHSDPKPLVKGYAFLIDTARKRYRVVRHEPNKEHNVVAWTDSNAINGGSEANKLEVRHKNDINEIYVNDTLLTSIRNVYGHKGGVAGLYAADGIRIGFKDLEIVK